MSPADIAALVAAQAPEHVQCRAQELVEEDYVDSKVVVQCACNVRLTLGTPREDRPVTINMSVMPGGEAEAGRAAGQIVKRSLEALAAELGSKKDPDVS